MTPVILALGYTFRTDNQVGLGDVFLATPQRENVQRWQYQANKPPGPLAAAVGAYLVKAYEAEWRAGGAETSLVFVGFNPLGFLRQLGVESSLPVSRRPLPPRLWRHPPAAMTVDLTRLLTPAAEDVLAAVRARIPADDKGKKAWQGLLADWPGPGVNAATDAALATEIGVQLGLFAAWA